MIKKKGVPDTSSEIESSAFLESVAKDLRYIVQRVNRNIDKGRPGPGATAGTKFAKIDYSRLKALAAECPDGFASFLKCVYNEVLVSQKAKWCKYVLKSFWKPWRYDSNNDPRFAVSYAQWYFASPLAQMQGICP